MAMLSFTTDTHAEIALLREKISALGTQAIVCKHWAEGGQGAVELGHEVLRMLADDQSHFRYLYYEHAPLWDKIKTVATRIYGASDITADIKARRQLAQLSKEYSHFPVCIAKTQSSSSADPEVRGAPSGHILPIREVRPAHGAEFVVVICGNIMTMPGLPTVAAAERINIDDRGIISGLF
jgi:formate--tetrahydrofolate ligase